MIPIVREVIDRLAQYIRLLPDVKYPILRKEQSIAKPEYPYGAYKLLRIDGSDYQIKTQVENADLAKVKYKYKKDQSAVVSLSFYNIEKSTIIGVNPIDHIWEAANISMDFLGAYGKSGFDEMGIVIDILDQSVQDRTSYIDYVYEYQVGFDFKVKAIREIEIEIDAIDLDATMSEMELIVE